MKSLFEQIGGTYRREGNYLLPNLLPPETQGRRIGKYGRLRKNYLKNHRPVIYNAMLLNGTLYQHLAEIDRTCHERMERMERMVRQMAERGAVTEALKTSAQLVWVGRMICIHNRAEEVVLSELVYD